MLAAKQAHTWDPYDVEELRGKTLGVVGYGDIGQACARIARAFKMDVVALRRRVQLSEQEAKEGLVVGESEVWACSHSQSYRSLLISLVTPVVVISATCRRCLAACKAECFVCRSISLLYLYVEMVFQSRLVLLSVQRRLKPCLAS
jgi:prephenate dehydrogenase